MRDLACGVAAGAAVALALRWLLSREQTRLTRYAHSADFPARSIGSDGKLVAQWYRDVFAATPTVPRDSGVWTPRETRLLRLTAQEYVEERRADRVTCEEYVLLQVRRARLYRHMNQWLYTSYARLDQCVDAARALDARAAAEGVEAIAPLYGLPVPMKGTGAMVDFPTGAGVGVLSGYAACKDCEMVARLRAAHAVVFGATNVPELGASVNTCNPASGQTRNPYDHGLTPGGSSGGAASAVAMGICAIAVSSEDTGGSTRIPALCNGLFGFDPARNHYPNGGNPALSCTSDQVGVLARTMEDVLLYDQAVGGAADGEDAGGAGTNVRRRNGDLAPWRPRPPECCSPPSSAASSIRSSPRLRGVQTPPGAARRGVPEGSSPSSATASPPRLRGVQTPPSAARRQLVHAVTAPSRSYAAVASGAAAARPEAANGRAANGATGTAANGNAANEEAANGVNGVAANGEAAGGLGTPPMTPPSTRRAAPPSTPPSAPSPLLRASTPSHRRRIRVGLPQQPFVVGEGGDALCIDAHMRAKYELAVAALAASSYASDGFTLVAEEWPPGDSPFDLIPHEAAVHTFGGQVQSESWVVVGRTR